MKFFDDLFITNESSNYSVSGLNKELTCINIYDTFTFLDIIYKYQILYIASD